MPQRVLDGEAESSAALRHAAFEGAGLSPDLKPLIDKVHAHAYKVSDEDVAIRDAFYVAFLFNTYDRLADTLGWELPEERYYPKAGRFLLKGTVSRYWTVHT
jgi:hypothetical protein